jgi:hypothetical protein
MPTLQTLAWPLARLGEAIETVARRCGLPLHEREPSVPPAELEREAGAALGAWIETTAT